MQNPGAIYINFYCYRKGSSVCACTGFIWSLVNELCRTTSKAQSKDVTGCIWYPQFLFFLCQDSNKLLSAGINKKIQVFNTTRCPCLPNSPQTVTLCSYCLR
jgi:hypothetical protein